MKTGNRRRRKLNRLAKARALRARCKRWQLLTKLESNNERLAKAIARFVEDASKAA